MEKNIKIGIGSGVLLFGIFLYIFFGTDLYRFYSNSSAANEPNLHIGSRVLVSSLIKPKRLDFVCFKYTDSFWGNNKRIHRLVGVPKDTLEIREGVLFVNNQNIDSTLLLAHSYKTTLKTAKKLDKNNELIYIQNDQLYHYTSSTDSVLIFLSNPVAKKYKLEKHKQITPKGDYDISIFEQFQVNWNIDNFGPLILKEKEYFVLGDNRHNAYDSRYTGIINESAIIGKATPL